MSAILLLLLPIQINYIIIVIYYVCSVRSGRYVQRSSACYLNRKLSRIWEGDRGITPVNWTLFWKTDAVFERHWGQVSRWVTQDVVRWSTYLSYHVRETVGEWVEGRVCVCLIIALIVENTRWVQASAQFVYTDTHIGEHILSNTYWMLFWNPSTSLHPQRVG